MSKTRNNSKKGSYHSKMSMKTKVIISTVTFALAVITVILCAIDGMFVFKPGSVQANDNAAAVMITNTPAPDDSGDESAAPKHSVLVSAGNGGTVYPSGSITVDDWGSVSVTAVPDDGFRIRSITVDGESVGALSSYTLSYITDDRTVLVTFERNETAPKPTQPPETADPGNEGGNDPGGEQNEGSGSQHYASGFGELIEEFFSIFGQ